MHIIFRLAVIFYKSYAFCFGKEQHDGEYIGSVTYAITPSCGPRIGIAMRPSVQCLHPPDNAALCCLRLAAFYSFLFFCGTELSLCVKLRLKAVIAPSQFCPSSTGASRSAKTMADATYVDI